MLDTAKRKAMLQRMILVLAFEQLRLVVAKALRSLKRSQELDYLRSRVDKENPAREIIGLSRQSSKASASSDRSPPLKRAPGWKRPPF